MIQDIQSYTPTSSDKFLIDTNVLLFLYCPLGNYQQFIIQKYSSFFNDMVNAGSTLYISSQILSEFINVYLRLDFKIFQNQSGNSGAIYKRDYRSSARFGPTVAALVNTLNNQVFNVVQKLDDNFANISASNILSNIDKIDHNDAYYAELVAGTGIKVLTDDKDYEIYKTTHEIFTGNPRLISAR
ncbi:MAG: hypothetical protein ACPGJV_11650 [Bacteriovoracaceae bacterium]